VLVFVLYERSRMGDTENLHDVIVTLLYTFILSWRRVVCVFRVTSALFESCLGGPFCGKLKYEQV
jgi:hypothetical protein